MSTSTPSLSLYKNRKVYQRLHAIPKSLQTIAPLHLKLMMLSCEDNPPYGPSKNTACMFLDLIVRARCEVWFTDSQGKECYFDGSKTYQELNGDSDKTGSQASVSITVYECKHFDYPSTDDEWNSYDGILLPGSFSSAYDSDLWIEKLKEVIRNKIQKYKIYTLAVCFGHQIFAHASDGGLAVKCPAGPQTGNRDLLLSDIGKSLYKSKRPNLSQCDRIRLLYTHSDMVEKLPDFAQNLGGNETVPIQSAAYFSSTENSESSNLSIIDNVAIEPPYALTFQAHPEYSSSIEFSSTFENVLNAMFMRGLVTKEKMHSSFQCAKSNSDEIVKGSMDTIVSVGFLFRWL